MSSVECDVRYETLREDWLAGRITGEVGLVRRQGLLAWVRAGPVDPPIRPASIDAADDPVRSGAAGHQLVAAFVELILNRRPEGPP